MTQLYSLAQIPPAEKRAGGNCFYSHSPVSAAVTGSGVDSSVAAAERYGLGYDLVAGANIVGFQRVADAMTAQGIF